MSIEAKGDKEVEDLELKVVDRNEEIFVFTAINYKESKKVNFDEHKSTICSHEGEGSSKTQFSRKIIEYEKRSGNEIYNY